MKVKRTVIEPPGGCTYLVYTTEDGSYLGRLILEPMDPRALKIMAEDLPQWLNEAEQPQLALPNGIQGDRPS